MRLLHVATVKSSTLIAVMIIGAAGWRNPTVAADTPPSNGLSAAKPSESPGAQKPEVEAGIPAGTSSSEPARTAAAEAKPKRAAFSDVLKDAQAIEGLMKLYRKNGKLYAELTRSHLNTDYIVIISIARGIGRSPLLAGMSWGTGDDWLWQFRKVDDRIQIVRRNVRFRAADGTPQARAVQLAYTDSILFSLPIATVSPVGGDIVDLTPVFMSDLPQISSFLPGFSFASDKSSWASVRAFKDNVELQVAATYSSSGSAKFDTVADSRGATINVHYSLSRLPQTGYQPRLADDRVGYFLTVVKDYSDNRDHDHFVRYINRWDLRKADAGSDLSPPVHPIVIWLEKTIPYKYRKPVREGILEWNKALEKAGFANAIEVRQQPDDATWDAEDINYNTFRWITSAARFAMGPTRVNPITGQILDSDIIFDADFLESWRENRDVVSPPGASAGPSDLEGYRQQLSRRPETAGHQHSSLCQCAQGMAEQYAFGSIVMAAADPQPAAAQLEEILLQGIKATVIHEVGHMLGLRHNFKASSVLSLDEINTPEKTRATGMAGSIMDYLPMNIVPKGQKQGDYFSSTIGPYDYWAIEYGYKPLSGGTEGEAVELKKIAARSAEPALAYGTDENTRGIDPDPLCNRFDLGKDPLQFARRQVQLFNLAWPQLVDRLVRPGDAYIDARRGFNILLGHYGNAMHFAARFIGGLYVHRDHKGDPNARPPMVVVEPQRQREAMTFLEQEVLSPQALQFPPSLYSHLAASQWDHWGTEVTTRVDYPLHDTLLIWQDRVLAQLLSSLTLTRLLDTEAKVPADQDAFTAAELFQRLTAAIFRETEKLQQGKFTARKPGISSLRRGLQRRYLQRMAELALGSSHAPEDCKTLAYAELSALESKINQVLAGKAELDAYTRAHLSETAARIRKILDARPVLPGFSPGGSSVILVR